MRLSVHEMARLSGVSVRTLHYYDALGLLHPAEVSETSGYRWYGEAEVKRLRQILFYRELDFPLREIPGLLTGTDDRQALLRQRELLELKRRRLDGLLALLDDNLKGERLMDFTGFDTREADEARAAYAAEAERRWGDTQAWKESREKRPGTEEQAAQVEEMNAVFRRFAALRSGDPKSPEAQTAVADWQAFLNEHCYTCTPEVLAGLGQMYAADERFRKNLNRFGAGTAEFMAAAIAAYCERK